MIFSLIVGYSKHGLCREHTIKIEAGTSLLAEIKIGTWNWLLAQIRTVLPHTHLYCRFLYLKQVVLVAKHFLGKHILVC